MESSSGETGSLPLPLLPTIYTPPPVPASLCACSLLSIQPATSMVPPPMAISSIHHLLPTLLILCSGFDSGSSLGHRTRVPVRGMVIQCSPPHHVISPVFLIPHSFPHAHPHSLLHSFPHADFLLSPLHHAVSPVLIPHTAQTPLRSLPTLLEFPSQSQSWSCSSCLLWTILESRPRFLFPPCLMGRGGRHILDLSKYGIIIYILYYS